MPESGHGSASVRAWRLASGSVVFLALVAMTAFRVCLGSTQTDDALNRGFHALSRAIAPVVHEDARRGAYDEAISHFSDATGSALTNGSLAVVALEFTVRLRSGDRLGLVEPMPSVLDRIAAGRVDDARGIWTEFRESGGAASAGEGAALVQEFLQRIIIARTAHQSTTQGVGSP